MWRLGFGRRRHARGLVVLCLIALAACSSDPEAPTATAGGGDRQSAQAGTPSPQTVDDPGIEGAPTKATGDRRDPVPTGEVATYPGLWDLMVSEVNLDATDEVLAYSEVNPAPEPGYRYVMISVTGVYRGEGVAQPAFEWAVYDGHHRYLPSIPGCGVIPSSIYDITQVEAGHRFSANLCMPVKESAADRDLQLSMEVVGGPSSVFALQG